ncbi:hypothetical protein [Cellulomonas dongxiuzhuiae]|uniref:Uncharacterized protein n=1 Tax=Cellulomonas dongxiuzhuiae TaxID=2819979 RepID=A0ABX8GGN1_9CELL|nr:hypothetical protein [Cellulomonas dongxiuzhuiae]MBO3094243.1 hypothetical protein [Cellulomonas dongxiuzhuiae]QWC15293.1 hypothetical protein KKR89_13355 [Cellulomonas dongxiuzhuiae]
MRTPRHRRVRTAAAVLSVAALLTVAACSGDDGVDPSTAEWPEAITPADADGEFFVVWTAIAENGDDPALATEVGRLAEEGYEVEPWSPGCQSGAQEQLSGLTGYAEPVGVGVSFASEEDAGIFDTRDEGTTVSLTQGTWTC